MHASLLKTNGDSNQRPPQTSRFPRARGVLLINLGTPDSPEVPDVRRYLAEFLSDPEVIRLPAGLGWFGKPLGRLIALLRSPRSAKLYRSIWTDRGSPLLTITRQQAADLESALPDGWRVFYAMRYGQPAIAETVREIESAGIDELVVVPMYPQFSGPTTGTALRELYGYLRRSRCQVNVTTRSLWFDDGGYVHAQAKLIYEHIRAQRITPEDTYLLFSAHGLPVSYAQRGDPYPRHIHRTVELVIQRLGWPAGRSSVAFQSRLGPAQWLQPATDETLRQLADNGEKKILVCPISFTTDCLETLEEIGMRYRALAESSGAELLLCPCPNTYPPFMSALKDLVLRGPSPVTSWSARVPPLMAPVHRKAADADIDSLVMVGTSLEGRLPARSGPRVAHTDPDGLRSVKRAQCEVPELLRTIHAESGAREAWLLNTCNRFEFYGWGSDPQDPTARARLVDAARRHLFGQHPAVAAGVNVLYGADAWHHLLRTTAGLNSRLPGERDILDQLEAAHRLADCTGTAGPLSRRLLSDVRQITDDMRMETAWGRFDPDYCHAALSRIAPIADLNFAQCRGLIIGGSTTSAGVLRTLIGRFEVPSRQLTLLYRGHTRAGHLKLLRKAIGNGKRLRVQDYAEPQVARAVADADVVVFGIDREKPVISARQIRHLREFKDRPLTIIDFNMFGSTTDLESIEGVRVFNAAELDAQVTAFADEMCVSKDFTGAVLAAEAWISEQVRGTAVTAPGRASLQRTESARGNGAGSASRSKGATDTPRLQLSPSQPSGDDTFAGSACHD